ncbi:MAG: hypothetical protein PHC75_02385 [Burkholderiales bacterium]|nr:hypothetical protein [Burkholderiales bacterium]
MKQILGVLLAVIYTNSNATISIIEKCSIQSLDAMLVNLIAINSKNLANDSGYINSNDLYQSQKTSKPPIKAN